MLLRIAAVKYEGRMNSTRVARLGDLLSIGLLLNESADKKLLFPHLKYKAGNTELNLRIA
jgi:hypothetical protein